MTGLEVMLAIVGFTVTTLVVVGMILITPRGEIDLHNTDSNDPQGSALSRAGMPSAPVPRAIDDDPVEGERITPSSPAARAPQD
jgi:hypothetical protein